MKVYFCLDDAMSCAREQDKRVLVVFSCHVCVGDRRFEEILFIKKKCSQLIAKHYIPVLLYIDDKSVLPIEDRKEVEWFDGSRKYIKTLGRLNQFIQFSKFNNNSQPWLVILDPDGNVVVDPIGFQSDHEEYFNFLLRGVEEK